MKQLTNSERRQPAIFAQLYKVDEERRLVYGRAASEEPDHSDEMMDYASSKPLFQKWSADVHKDSGGKSFGNVREMHQPLAVGKMTEIEFDDDAQAIDIVVKVVDDAAWEKVLEGVYTGFSIGGKYIKKWEAPSQHTESGRVKKYTAHPSEVSLVDRPCMPSSKFFEVMKRDGSVEEHLFKGSDDEARDDHGRWTGGGSDNEAKAKSHLEQADYHNEVASRHSDHATDFLNGRGSSARHHEQAADSHRKAAAAHGKAAQSLRNDEPKANLHSAWADDATHTANRMSARTKDGKNFMDLAAEKADQPLMTKQELTDMAKLLRRAAGDKIEKDFVSPVGDTSGIQPYGTDADDKPPGRRLKRPADLPATEKVSGKGGVSEVSEDADGANTETTKVVKRAYTDQERQEAARTGAAMKDGSFPIHDKSDLHNALQAFGRAKDKDKTKAHIKTRATALGHEGDLPDDWSKIEKRYDDEAEETLESGDDTEVLAQAEGLGDLLKRAHEALEKKGARNSKSDKGLLQKLHDTAVALGADCGSAKITPIGKSTGDTDMRVRKGGIKSEGPKRGAKIASQIDSEHSDNEEADAEDGTTADRDERESKGGSVKSKRGVGKAQTNQNDDDDEDEDEEDMDEDEDDAPPAKKVRKGGRVAKRRDEEEDDTMTSADLAKMVASTVVATLQGLGILESNAPVKKNRRDNDEDEGEELTKFSRRPAMFAVDRDGDTERLDKADRDQRAQRDDRDPLELALIKRVAEPITQNNGKMDVASTLIKHIHGQKPMRTVTADGMSLKS